MFLLSFQGRTDLNSFHALTWKSMVLNYLYNLHGLLILKGKRLKFVK